MEAHAIVINNPRDAILRPLEIDSPTEEDAIVDVTYTGISTGTERLIWTGAMPPFPGMGYPLVPGYEATGTVIQAPKSSKLKPGDTVFAPGAKCYGEVHGLFGAASSRIVTPAERLIRLPEAMGPEGVLIALAATAHHAMSIGGLPDLIIGHGVLGRLMARLTVALGGKPTVWECNEQRFSADNLYPVRRASEDPRQDYQVVIDASGDADVIDQAVRHMAKGSLFVLAGFYHRKVNFTFPPVFMRQMTVRVAAEWVPEDLKAVVGLLAEHPALLTGIVTHMADAAEGADAYQRALEDPACLKMVLDWRQLA